MTSRKCKLNFVKVPSYFMNFPTHVTGVFYQFHKSSKWVRDFFKTNSTCGTSQFHDSGLLPLANQFHESSKPSGSRIVNFSLSSLLVHILCLPVSQHPVVGESLHTLSCTRFDCRINLEATMCAHIQLCSSLAMICALIHFSSMLGFLL